jgi:prepilin-type N-terminal cleavage/methylation domain-containing protein
MMDERGMTFIEILVGLAIVSAVTTAFIYALVTVFNGIDIGQERVAAEGLAKSQIEYIKTQEYVPVAYYDPNDPLFRYESINITDDLAAAGYTLIINLPEVVVPATNDAFEVQRITIDVDRDSTAKLSVSFYKLDD